MTRVPWFALMAAAIVLLICAHPAAAIPAAPQVSRVTAFDRYVIGGGWVTIGLLIPISFIALSLVIQNIMRLRNAMVRSAEVLQGICSMMQQGDYVGAVRVCTADPSTMAQIAHSGFQCAAEGPVVMRRMMEQTLDERAAVLLRRLDYLNLIGHVAPMVGLFGTVHGIIGMFSSIAEEGGIPVMSSISEDLGAALIATFWGLLIAIPSLAAFHILRGKADIFLQQCSAGIDRIMLALRRKPTPAPAPRPAALQPT